MRQAHKKVEAAIVRLLALVEKGLMEAEDPNLKERLVGLKVQRDELALDISGLQEQITSGEPVITRAKPGPRSRSWRPYCAIGFTTAHLSYDRPTRASR